MAVCLPSDLWGCALCLCGAGCLVLDFGWFDHWVCGSEVVVRFGVVAFWVCMIVIGLGGVWVTWLAVCAFGVCAVVVVL